MYNSLHNLVPAIPTNPNENKLVFIHKTKRCLLFELFLCLPKNTFFLALYGPNSFFRRFSGHNLR